MQVDGEAVLPGALERMRDTHRQAARDDRECGSAHAQVAQDSTGTRDVRLANEQVEVPGEPMAHAAVKSSRHGQALQQQVLEAGAPEGRIDLGEGTLESGIPLLLSLPLVAQALECGRGPERAECERLRGGKGVDAQALVHEESSDIVEHTPVDQQAGGGRARLAPLESLQDRDRLGVAGWVAGLHAQARHAPWRLSRAAAKTVTGRPRTDGPSTRPCFRGRPSPGPGSTPPCRSRRRPR